MSLVFKKPQRKRACWHPNWNLFTSTSLDEPSIDSQSPSSGRLKTAMQYMPNTRACKLWFALVMSLTASIMRTCRVGGVGDFQKWIDIVLVYLPKLEDAGCVGVQHA
jgi:hypothetical protein